MNADDVRLVKTCEACPEQYDAVGPAGEPLAYLRLRWGSFTVRCPDVAGEVVYDVGVGGDLTGAFRSERQREAALRRARRIIARWHSTNTNPEGT